MCSVITDTELVLDKSALSSSVWCKEQKVEQQGHSTEGTGRYEEGVGY